MGVNLLKTTAGEEVAGEFGREGEVTLLLRKMGQALAPLVLFFSAGDAEFAVK